MTVSTGRPPEGSLGLWGDLADRALVAPGLNRPEVLLPALQQTPGAVLAVVAQDGKPLLGLPLTGSRTLSSSLSNSGLPIMDANLGEAAIAALLRHMRGPIILNGVPADGPFWEALNRSAARIAVLNRWQRAGLRFAGSYDDWFESNFDRKRRNTLRRMASKVAALPGYACRTLAKSDSVTPWVEALLALEAAGWKGARGTALEKVGMAKAFSTAAHDLHQAGKLRFWQLSAEGQTLATVFAIVDGGHAAFGKIAYNESYGRFSPGVLIMLEATRSLFAEPDMVLADGCAIPNHPMMDHLWRDRIAMADVMVAGPQVSSLSFRLRIRFECTRRALREWARDAYYRLIQRQRT